MIFGKWGATGGDNGEPCPAHPCPSKIASRPVDACTAHDAASRSRCGRHSVQQYKYYCYNRVNLGWASCEMTIQAVDRRCYYCLCPSLCSCQVASVRRRKHRPNAASSPARVCACQGNEGKRNLQDPRHDVSISDGQIQPSRRPVATCANEPEKK